ncbi:MAG TPA: glycosyltransferase family 39 protein [Chthoniobacterales bacterium]|nr:glycosyltransferase family 39 protein [Chthoniobacterales bacterium]
MVTDRPGRRTWRKIFLAKWWQRCRTHVVLLVWAAIYLPGLGSLEIKGEEGRRILPAVTMLQTGNYLVPYVGSEPYFRKPPLVNWIAAASFKLSGFRTEWTARLPSALAILAVALASVTRGRRALGTTGSLLAALIWLVNAGNMEKGRLIEIEAIYVSLTALAFIFWMAAYREEKTGAQLWLSPAIFLGLGMLAKGPLPHLLFFYGPVIAVLWNDGKLSLLARREHAIALIIMVGIFVAWALPAFLLSDWGRVARVWSRQYTGRVSGGEFQFSSWIMNIPRGLVYFLPWLPLALLQFDQPVELRRRHYALLLGIGVPFVLVNLIPGALPRFAMPALGPASWWLGELLVHDNLRWPPWLSGKMLAPRLRNRIVVGFVVLGCIWGLAYGLIATPFLRKREKVRQHARQIDAIVPTNIPLYAVNPKYQPYLFYVRAPIRYVSTIEQLPIDTKFFLVQEADEEEAQTTKHWLPSRAQMVLRIKDYRDHEEVLFSVPSRR